MPEMRGSKIRRAGKRERMSGIVKSIAQLEAEADGVIEGAKAEARGIEKAAEGEVASYRGRLDGETRAKVAAYEDEARGRHEAAMAEAGRELEGALAALDGISGQAIGAQAARVVDYFKKI